MKFAKQNMESIIEDSAPEGFEIIETGKWVSYGKTEWQKIVFKHNEKFYQLEHSRSGSHFTDYYYDSQDWDDEVEVDEVRPVQKTITIWEVVK